MFIVQLNLKNALDRISHDSIAEMLCRKNLCPQLVAVLCSWWCCSSLEVRLGHVTSYRCISVDRGVPQGAPESPLVFVTVADEILEGLRPSWERIAWTCDAVSLSCLGYADDVLLFSGSKASLETMIEDCCTKFGEAGLEVVLDKTHWSSSIAMDGETLTVRGQSIEWGTETGVHWVCDRAWCAQWWSGETVRKRHPQSFVSENLSCAIRICP